MLKHTLTLSTMASLALGQTLGSIDGNFTLMVGSTGNSLSGYHVGAGQSWMTAAAGAGDVLTFNSSSSMVLDSSIVSGEPVPCYVSIEASISSNAGPLECGVTDTTGDYDIADPTSSSLSLQGISNFYLCTVTNSAYGNITGVVVGSVSNSTGTPSGPGISDCGAAVELDAVSSGAASSSVSSSVLPATSSAANATAMPSYANSTVITLTSTYCPECENPSTTVYVTTCPVTTGANGSPTPVIAATTMASAGSVATASPNAAQSSQVASGSDEASTLATSATAASSTSSMSTYTGAGFQSKTVSFGLVVLGMLSFLLF